jgi:hypothetical protein
VEAPNPGAGQVPREDRDEEDPDWPAPVVVEDEVPDQKEQSGRDGACDSRSHDQALVQADRYLGHKGSVQFSSWCQPV